MEKNFRNAEPYFYLMAFGVFATVYCYVGIMRGDSLAEIKIRDSQAGSYKVSPEKLREYDKNKNGVLDAGELEESVRGYRVTWGVEENH